VISKLSVKSSIFTKKVIVVKDIEVNLFSEGSAPPIKRVCFSKIYILKNIFNKMRKR